MLPEYYIFKSRDFKRVTRFWLLSKRLIFNQIKGRKPDGFAFAIKFPIFHIKERTEIGHAKNKLEKFKADNRNLNIFETRFIYATID